MLKQCLGLGRPGGGESLHLSPVEFIQVAMARGYWVPAWCWVITQHSGGHGNLGADWGGVTR